MKQYFFLVCMAKPEVLACGVPYLNIFIGYPPADHLPSLLCQQATNVTHLTLNSTVEASINIKWRPARCAFDLYRGLN